MVSREHPGILERPRPNVTLKQQALSRTNTNGVGQNSIQERKRRSKGKR